MPIKRKRLEWAMPLRDWELMSNDRKREFLLSKGFDEGVKIIKGTSFDSHLIKFVQEFDDIIITEENPIEQTAYERLIKDYLNVPVDILYPISKRTKVEVKNFEEWKEAKKSLRGLQFYPTTYTEEEKK